MKPRYRWSGRFWYLLSDRQTFYGPHFPAGFPLYLHVLEPRHG